MPAVLPFIPLIVAGVTAAGTGVGLYETISHEPSTPKISTTPTPLTGTQNAAQQAAVSQSLPNLQSITGGSLSPEYAAQFGATQSGVANDPQATGNVQAAINQFFGITAPGQTGLTPTSSSAPSGGGGILDFIKPGGSSAPPAGAPPGGFQNWISQATQGNDYRGLAG